MIFSSPTLNSQIHKYKIKAQKSETYHAYINFEKYEGEKGGGREREEGRGRRQNVN